LARCISKEELSLKKLEPRKAKTREKKGKTIDKKQRSKCQILLLTKHSAMQY
jgi:hypothetical protein